MRTRLFSATSVLEGAGAAATLPYTYSPANDSTTPMQSNAAAKLQIRWRRKACSRIRRSAEFASGSAAGALEPNHSRRATNAAAPRITTKKKTSLRTIGPMVDISVLRQEQDIASLST